MSSNVVLRNNIRPRRGSALLERWLLQQIFKAIGPAPIRLKFTDGETLCPPGSAPLATIEMRDLATLARMMIDPEVAFGEAYSEGRVEVHGDLVKALEAVYESWPAGRANTSWYQKLTSKWMANRQENSLYGSRHNIHSHYDLGNDFYKLWLDRQLVYTCAYFPHPAATLEEAQEAKLDYVCRKLNLQPGERVVEAGCGWGSLALHMARRYGVTVKAFNISHEQIEYARNRASEMGLTKNVEFVEDDWRNIRGPFDVFVSVGMLEHVGLADYTRMGEVIHRSIGDSGRGLLHFIGRSYKGAFSRWIRKRIFPGAYAPTLAEAMKVLQPHRYAVLDVENLRPHYERTVEHWLERFEASGQRVSDMYGDWFRRAWRLYLAGSIAAFHTGTLQLFQVSFAGPRSPLTSWTRAPLYRDSTKWTPTMS
jgi:cyclopropane-fatty-acyl-phospholipid synthase